MRPLRNLVPTARNFRASRTRLLKEDMTVDTRPHDPRSSPTALWFSQKSSRELQRTQRLLAPAEVVSLEERKVLLEDAERPPVMTPSGPWILLRKSSRELDPPVVLTGGLLPDLHAVPADQIAVEKDLREPLQTAFQNWPRAERDIFELYFIEGFEPYEIAMNLPVEILAALEFSALDPKAFCRIDELAYRTEGRSGHGRA